MLDLIIPDIISGAEGCDLAKQSTPPGSNSGQKFREQHREQHREQLRDQLRDQLRAEAQGAA